MRIRARKNNCNIDHQGRAVTTFVRGLLLFAMALIVVTAIPSEAQQGKGNLGNPGVIPPQAHYNGMTYAEWSVAWWQWILGTPVDENPFGADKCAFGTSDKNGHVWFLVSDIQTSNTTTVRTCDVPVGKALLFPIYNTECSTVEGDPFFLDLAAAHPEECVEKFFDPSFHFRTVRNLSVKIDGTSVRNLEEYLFQSEIFNFVLPSEGDNYIEVPADACDNPDGCHAIAEGYYIMLAPLSKGHHTIEIYAETWDEQTQMIRRYVHTRYELEVIARKQ
jgi:hypothetical protein